jgi:hypothetical protein
MYLISMSGLLPCTLGFDARRYGRLRRSPVTRTTTPVPMTLAEVRDALEGVHGIAAQHFAQKKRLNLHTIWRGGSSISSARSFRQLGRASIAFL